MLEFIVNEFIQYPEDSVRDIIHEAMNKNKNIKTIMKGLALDKEERMMFQKQED